MLRPHGKFNPWEGYETARFPRRDTKNKGRQGIGHAASHNGSAYDGSVSISQAKRNRVLGAMGRMGSKKGRTGQIL